MSPRSCAAPRREVLSSDLLKLQSSALVLRTERTHSLGLVVLGLWDIAPIGVCLDDTAAGEPVSVFSLCHSLGDIVCAGPTEVIDSGKLISIVLFMRSVSVCRALNLWKYC